MVSIEQGESQTLPGAVGAPQLTEMEAFEGAEMRR